MSGVAHAEGPHQDWFHPRTTGAQQLNRRQCGLTRNKVDTCGFPMDLGSSEMPDAFNAIKSFRGCFTDAVFTARH